MKFLPARDRIDGFIVQSFLQFRNLIIVAIIFPMTDGEMKAESLNVNREALTGGMPVEGQRPEL